MGGSVAAKGRKIGALLGAVVMLAALVAIPAAPAMASHGTSCLDITPETDFNPTGTSHVLTATLRAAGVPPTACTGAPATRGFPVNIDFEIETGSDLRVNCTPASGSGEDPNFPRCNGGTPADNTSSRTTPDMTCTIQVGTSSCTVTYTADTHGTNLIRGWVDEDNTDTTPEADATEGRNETTSPGTDPMKLEPDDTDVVEKTWAASRLDCSPETATNQARATHTITCKALNEKGVPVEGAIIDAEFIGTNDLDDGDSKDSPDETCTTDVEGECSFTHGGADAPATGITTYVMWVDVDDDDATVEADNEEGRDEIADPGTVSEPDWTDVTEKIWVSGNATRLDCDDQSGDDLEVNATGEAETYTCTASDQDGNPVAGALVDAENMGGANDPDDDALGNANSTNDYTCAALTTADGRCTITVPATESETGNADICFWLDGDNDDRYDAVGRGETNPPPGAANDGGDCDAEQGPPADEAERNDATDKVRKTWESSGAGDIAGGLDAQPETDVNHLGEFHTITVTVYDQFGQPVDTNTRVRAEFFMGSPTDTDNNTPNSPDDACSTGDASTPNDRSTCLIRYQAPATTAGKDLVCLWIGDRPPVMAGDNTNGLCDAEGARDPAADDGPPSPSNDRIDVVEKWWAAENISCAQDSRRSRSGEPNTITCTATNANGDPVSGQAIDAEYDGAGDPDNSSDRSNPDATCTTEADGTCEFEHTSDEAGDTNYVFWIDEDQNNTTTTGDSTSLTHTWTASVVDCEPETDENPIGDSHTVTCAAEDAAGNPVAGEQIDWELSGANDPDDGDAPGIPDYECVTAGPSGSCSFTHVGTQTGTTLYRAWLDDDDDNDAADADQDEAVDETTPVGAGAPEDDSTDVVEKNWIGPGLDCTPETAQNPTGDTHEITCTLRDSDEDGIPNRVINVEATGANDPDNADSTESPDFTCTTGSDGSCTITHVGNAPGETVYRAWAEGTEPDMGEEQDESTPATEGDEGEPDETDVVSKTWVTQVLDCEPETDSNPTGTSHTVTCTAETSQGLPLSGADVDVEATGANDPDASDSPETPDFTCTTSQTGTCSFTHGPTATSSPSSTSSEGTTTYRAWIDRDGDHSATPATHGTVEADRTEERNEATAPGTRPEPDDTDVVEKVWLIQQLNCEPETDSNPTNSAHTVTCTVTTGSGSSSTPVSNSNLDAEATGANDPDSSDSPQSPDFTCTTDNNGRCSFTHGPGGTGRTATAGTTTYRVWVDSDRNDATTEADATEGRNEALQPGSKSEVDDTDVVEKTWVAPPIDCSPEVDGNPVGTAHTVTCSAQPGTQIDVEASGANDPDNTDSPSSPDFTCTTNAAGTCSFTHGPGGTGSTTSKGTTTYRAWLDADGSNLTVEADTTEGRNENVTPGSRQEPDETDVVEKNWTSTASSLTLSPESDSATVGTCNPYTVTVIDSSNQGISGLVIDVEQRHTTADNATVGDEPQVSFCTPTEGPNPSSVDQTQGDLDPPEETPDNRGTLGGETTQTTNSSGQITFGIRSAPAGSSDGSGLVNITAFLDSDDDADPDNDESKDTSTKTWLTSNARNIDCEPESADAPVGDSRTVTCVVRDQFGEPAAGQSVTFTEEGPGSFTTSTVATTDSEGKASATVTSDEAGTQQITGTITDDVEGTEPNETDDCDRNAGDPSGSGQGVCSDSVSVVWTATGDCASRGEGNVIQGTSGADTITGTPGRDIICGAGGDDVIDGAGGDDLIFGDDGADTIRGGAGNDKIIGGRDNDNVSGNAGADLLKGAANDDTLNGNGGKDRLRGGGGNDAVQGGSKADYLTGGQGDDTLRGGKGPDRLDGGLGRDSCFGNAGRDRITNCE